MPSIARAKRTTGPAGRAHGVCLRPERLVFLQPFVTELAERRLRASKLFLALSLAFPGGIFPGEHDTPGVVARESGSGEPYLGVAAERQRLRQTLMPISVVPGFCAQRRDLERKPVGVGQMVAVGLGLGVLHLVDIQRHFYTLSGAVYPHFYTHES